MNAQSSRREIVYILLLCLLICIVAACLALLFGVKTLTVAAESPGILYFPLVLAGPDADGIPAVPGPFYVPTPTYPPTPTWPPTQDPWEWYFTLTPDAP